MQKTRVCRNSTYPRTHAVELRSRAPEQGSRVDGPSSALGVGEDSSADEVEIPREQVRKMIYDPCEFFSM